MKKIFLALGVAITIMFSGCAGKSTSPAIAGSLSGTDVSTYLIGEYMDVPSASSKLEAAGFEILATYKSIKKGTTIVFTNAELKEQAAKPTRAHAAVLRLFVDEQEKMISFTNPIYFGKAFMQDDYNHAVFSAQLEKIKGAFPDLKPSADKWGFDGLPTYHFMLGMPYYNEPDTLATGSNSELIAKANSYKDGKLKIFELKLSDSSTLFGYKLATRTSKFVKKIGRANAAILPWCIAIEDSKATALSAKYYIAMSYPLLDMGGFMGIMTVPGAVIADLEKVFK